MSNLQDSQGDSLEDNDNSQNGRPRLPFEEVKQRLQSFNNQALGFIKEHPAACLLGAVAVGYLVARLARRQWS